MESKDNLYKDVTDELNLDKEEVDTVDNVIEAVHSLNLETASEEVLSKYGVNVEVSLIEIMIAEFTLDPTSERFNKDIYNLYMKEYA